MVDVEEIVRQGYWYAALQGSLGIERTQLEDLLGGHDRAAPIIDAMIREGYLIATGRERVRAGRPVTRDALACSEIPQDLHDHPKDDTAVY